MASEINEYSYDKLLNLTAAYNRRLQNDKISRLPFLDNATGIAQRPCLLYRHSWEREAGIFAHIYNYPPHKWKKTKRSGPPHSSVLCSTELWNGVAKGGAPLSQELNKDAEDEDSRSTWAAGPDCEIDSEGSDFMDETYGSRRRRKKARSRMNRSLGHAVSSGRRRTNYQNYGAYDEDSNDRPIPAPYVFMCEVCGVRYRSRTGLNYHFNSQHPNAVRTGSGRIPPTYADFHSQPQSNGASNPSNSVSAANSLSSTSANAGLLSSLIEGVGTTNASRHCAADRGSSIVEADNSGWRSSNASDVEYSCDFCLGNERMNKKTGLPEDMLRCSDCGRCAHFSCLQFTANMVASVKTYHWQCIECKTCWLCGTSENDEQMLFCDDCDRGYHMYCLNPPLSEPPEGSWSCKLCVEHFQDAAASYQHSEESVAKAKSATNARAVDVISGDTPATNNCAMLPVITVNNSTHESET
ncbi:unnamed protein product [Calicophoron daubneyi]|uniref:Zinc finger protein ubi-d4 n=1 Tax=Calicophoron daubneyi TaxID=300641 RepID=A0AAV2TMR2_CALDB